MSLAQSLAEILNKMGGKVKTGGEGAILAEIADTYEADKPELPAVTADDNGKVLTVVDGGWDKAESSDIIQVPTEMVSNLLGEAEYHVEMTPDEIHRKIKSGKLLFLNARYDGQENICYVLFVTSSSVSFTTEGKEYYIYAIGSGFTVLCDGTTDEEDRAVFIAQTS